jgi:hypothetical protein
VKKCTMVYLFDVNIHLLALVAHPFLCGYSNHALIEHILELKSI